MATKQFVSSMPFLLQRQLAFTIGALATFATFAALASAQQLEAQFPGSYNGALGSAVSSGYDCDGDGVPDIVVGAPLDGSSSEGFIYLYSGASHSLINSFSLGPILGPGSGFGG